MRSLVVRAHVALVFALSSTLADDPGPDAAVRRRGDRGQTTAEYALVLLGAAGIALLLVAWATKSGAIGKLFDLVLNSVMDKVG
jgi:hypothetical protein